MPLILNLQLSHKECTTMNASTNSMNVSAETEYLMSLDNESSMPLNQNVEFSQLDISEIDQNESKAQANGSKIKSNATNKLSITMNTPEHRMLHKVHKEKKPASVNSLTMTLPNEQSSNAANQSQPEVSELLEESAMGAEDQSEVREQTTNLEEEPTEMCEHTETMDSYMAEETQTLCDNERQFFQQTCVELGRRLWKSNALAQQYTKGCIWSPDGTCVLVPVHLDGMHVIELPTDLYDVDSIPLERKVNELPSAVHVKEGGTVYDYVWFPFMNSTAPETCCWLASRQHEPIHMWDAFNGELRCTYRGYDDVDEVESAISVIFSSNGEQVIGGYKKSIKVFNTNIPGRNCNAVPVKQAISCFAINGSNDDTITAGSWNGCIYHYDLRVPKLGSLFTLSGHSGGVTWLNYVPSADSYMLFSGARKDNKILQWDMRNYTQPVREFQRNVDTNQRIYFDLSPQCEWLVSGDTQGVLRIWDLCNEAENIELPLHHDCCNGVNFHPTRPILATSAGQYHFINNNEDEEELKTKNQEPSECKEKLIDYENSLLLLWFGKSDDNDI